MTSLATSDDVAERLGRDLTTAEETRIEAVLADASNAVRARARQQFTAETTTTILRVRNRTVRLPQQAVADVATVTDLTDNDVSFTWYTGDTFLTLASTSYLNAFELNFPTGYALDRVKVTYTHGYETIPEDVVGIVANVAARALGSAPDESGEPSETIGSYSHGATEGVASGPFALLEDEGAVLDAYRLLAGPIPVI